jgi:hypothetical protein
LDIADIRLVRNESCNVCLAIQNEDKIRSSMKAMSDEKLEILSSGLCLRVGV